MVRAPYFKNGLKKGTWSKDEDERLRSYIHTHGVSNWRKLPKFAGLSRCGKSCRLRWMNYLQPNLKHGNYTQEEDEIIIKSHQQLGNKWSLIAQKLHGRTDSDIKNHWHCQLKKQLECNEISKSEFKDKPRDDTSEKEIIQRTESENSINSVGTSCYDILESSLSMSTKTFFTSNPARSAMNWPREEDSIVSGESFDDYWIYGATNIIGGYTNQYGYYVHDATELFFQSMPEFPKD